MRGFLRYTASMNPKDALEASAKWLKEMEAAKRLTLKVGLPSDKVGGKVYGGGTSIITVGATHEYSSPTSPARSFLRMPFEVKRKEIDTAIQNQFANVIDGKMSAEDALNRVGVIATNISKEAFRTNGYGRWAPLAEITKVRKVKAGKTTTLIWSGLLRGAITWSVS